MRLFILSSILTASMALLLVDFRITRYHLNREQAVIEQEINRLQEDLLIIESEVQRELASPHLRHYITVEQGLVRDTGSAKHIATLLGPQEDGTRRVDDSTRRPR